jgi:hypothetical protein
MAWDVEGTDEFVTWWETLTAATQVEVAKRVNLLVEHGPALKRPVVGAVRTSRHANMKELRVTVHREDLRILFVFAPDRTAILLLGGSKTGRWRAWYRSAVPQADALYETYLSEKGLG